MCFHPRESAFIGGHLFFLTLSGSGLSHVSAPAGAEQAGGFPRIDAHPHFTREYSPSLLFPILQRNRVVGAAVGGRVPAHRVPPPLHPRVLSLAAVPHSPAQPV